MKSKKSDLTTRELVDIAAWALLDFTALSVTLLAVGAAAGAMFLSLVTWEWHALRWDMLGQIFRLGLAIGVGLWVWFCWALLTGRLDEEMDDD